MYSSQTHSRDIWIILLPDKLFASVTAGLSTSITFAKVCVFEKQNPFFA